MSKNQCEKRTGIHSNMNTQITHQNICFQTNSIEPTLHDTLHFTIKPPVEAETGATLASTVYVHTLLSKVAVYCFCNTLKLCELQRISLQTFGSGLVLSISFCKYLTSDLRSTIPSWCYERLFPTSMKCCQPLQYLYDK